MIVKIQNKIPLYKKEEEALNIELIELEGMGFQIVSQKGLYNIGDSAIYIEPDYNLPDIPLFEPYIRPNGDSNKSRLGANNRIRAIKFNFCTKDCKDVVYSNGILLQLDEVVKHVGNDVSDIYAKLGITKIEVIEQEKNSSGLTLGQSKPFPKGWYTTDETNFLKLCNSLPFPMVLVGTEKCDGSSISISSEFICSRRISKPIFTEKVVGARELTRWEKLKKVIYSWFRKPYRPDVSIKEAVLNDSDFVVYGKLYKDLLEQHAADDIVLRGELNGEKAKGSGNKHNPSAKEPTNIKFYGADKLVKGKTIKLDYLSFRKVVDNLNLPTVKEVFNRQFENKEDLIATCNEYFKNNLIEGLVCRNLDSTISFKFMNNEYDAKK